MASSNGNIIVNSEEISSTVSAVNEVVSILENDMKAPMNSNFNTLVDLGLFSDGIENIKKQIDSITKSYKALAVEMSSHLNEFEETEDTLSNGVHYYNNSNNSNKNNNSTGPTGENNSNQNTSIPNIEEGKEINASTLSNNIFTISDESQSKLIEFLNINKTSTMNLNSLLFDSKNAIALVTLLKKFYGDESTTTINIEDATLIQKTLINKLFSSKTTPVSISDNTILVAKKYLNFIAKNNNITVGDLLIDSKNHSILSDSLLQIYDGDAMSQFYLTENEINDVREYMNNVAKKNNSTVESLIQEPTKFL